MKKPLRCTYEPGLLDKFDPKVIKGVPIKPGTEVTITNDRVDPRGWFVWITDGTNEQSVFRKALVCKR